MSHAEQRIERSVGFQNDSLRVGHAVTDGREVEELGVALALDLERASRGLELVILDAQLLERRLQRLERVVRLGNRAREPLVR